MEIELPDGTVLEAPDDADPSVVAKNYLAQQKTAAPVDKPKAPPMTLGGRVGPFTPPPGQKPVGDLYSAILEPAASLVSGTAGTALGGIAGLGAIGTNALGLTKTEPADVVRGIQGAITYEPRTKAGDAVNSAIAYPFEKLANFADRAGDAINTPQPNRPLLARYGAGQKPMTQKDFGSDGSPLLATAVNTGIQSLPALLTRRGRVEANVDRGVNPNGAALEAGEIAPAPKSSSPTKRAAGLEGISASAQRSPASTAVEAGYKLKPSEAGGSKMAQLVEGATGSAKLETSLVKRNQENTHRLVREDFGLRDGQITKEAVSALKKPYNDVYAEVAKLGEVPVTDAFRADISKIGRTPGKSFQKDTNKSVEDLRSAYIDESSFNASDAVLKVRELRYKANKNISNRDPALQELGRAQRDIAEAIDNQLERHASVQGKTELVKNYRNARQELARLNSLDTAIRGNEVSAPILAKMLERGVPLSGSLRTIAKTAQEFPNVMREGRKVKGNTPVNMWETTMGAVGGGTALLGSPLAAAPMVASAIARPIARSVLTSDRYQNKLAREPGLLETQKPKERGLLTY